MITGAAGTDRDPEGGRMPDRIRNAYCAPIGKQCETIRPPQERIGLLFWNESRPWSEETSRHG